MRKSTAAALAFAVGAVLVPIGARAAHEGCIVTGEVQGLDTLRTCTYVARTTTQNVYVGTPYEWRIWVLRWDDNGQPLDVTLASGVGPQPEIPQVHPEVDEVVSVTMSFGCTPPYCGTIGFLAAGLEQGHP
jgi:hypothetical protein